MEKRHPSRKGRFADVLSKGLDSLALAYENVRTAIWKKKKKIVEWRTPGIPVTWERQDSSRDRRRRWKTKYETRDGGVLLATVQGSGFSNDDLQSNRVKHLGRVRMDLVSDANMIALC